MPQLIIIVFILFAILMLFSVFGVAIFAIFIAYLVYEFFWQIFEYFYYRSEKFTNIKNNISKNTEKCNELNIHIEELKKSFGGINRAYYGQATYKDNSILNFKRHKIVGLQNSPNIYDCSLSVCKNAQTQPFKYFCKYFNIKVNEDTLENFEKTFNDFSAVEEGKQLLKSERDSILNSLSDKIPFLVIKFRQKKLLTKLGFSEIDFSQHYFPKYTFRYISAGGNSSMICDILFDIENLECFIKYLSEIIKFKASIAGQRALMSSSLREKIKQRDNYTCQNCGLSIRDEANLLLEIDHIIPLSKGGITSKKNLQTLCWKCNRAKSNKIINK